MSGRPNCTCNCTEESADQMMERLHKIIDDYRDKPGALIPVLQHAQGIFGYLPENVIETIALGLNKSFSEVAGVVGFYSFFSTVPRGKHVIRICMGTACYVRGSNLVLEAFKKELGVNVGETTPDRLFTLEIARCFGACGLAPAITVDEEVFHRVDAGKVSEIIQKFRNDATYSADTKTGGDCNDNH